MVDSYFDLYDMSLPALKTALYIDNLRRGKRLEDYELYVKKVIKVFSELSEKENIKKSPPNVSCTLGDFFDPNDEHQSYDYLKKQSSKFAKDLSRIEKLSRKEKENLEKRCCDLHDILLREEWKRGRRMGMAA